jgi:secretory lipase
MHPYLIGESEGRAVLDSVRAARDLPDAGASNRFAVWGHSQAGHASLYTGELAASYAPDLRLVGVAAAAPATYLIELFDADKSSPVGKELTAMALYSWSALYHDPATTLVDAAAMPVYEQLAHDCIESVPEFAAIEKAEKPLNREQFLPRSAGAFGLRVADASPLEHELASQDRQDHDHQESDKENKEQDLRDLSRSRGHARVAERACDQRDQETDECPFQKSHAPSFGAPSALSPSRAT